MGFDGSQVTEVGSSIKAGGKRVGAGFARVIRKGAADIERDAKINSPVGETGDLRGSISTTITGDGRFGTVTAEVGPTVEYGDYVERGTRKMGAQPYLGPAFDRNLPTIEKAVVTLGGQIL